MTTLTPAARKLGEQHAFPVSSPWAVMFGEVMTYRQYLIAKNVAAIAGGHMANGVITKSPLVASAAIRLADATLNALAEEQS